MKSLPKKYHIISVLIFLSLVFFIPKEIKAEGASLYLSPSEGTFFVGSTFDVSIFVNTGKNDINTVQVDLKFDPKKVQVASPSAGKSFISIWISQPSYSNTEGTLSFRGGIPTPGINTSSGLVSTVTFRAISPGLTNVSFSDSSKVLLNDGKGTNVLTSMSRGTYALLIPPPEGPKIFSPTHPDQNKWYKNNNPTFSWDKEEGISDFSYTFDTDAYGTPDNNAEGSYTSVSYSDVKDGIWYFHLKAKKGDIWGGTSSYLVQIDYTPPAAFSPIVYPSANTTEKQPLISFITTDSLSGIDHYEVKYIDVTQGKEEKATGFFVEAVSPYRLSLLELGRYLVIVRAYDAAGNYQEGTVKIQIFPEGFFFSEKGLHFRGIIISWVIIFIVALLLLLIIVLIILLAERRRRRLIRERRENLERIQKDLENRRINYMQ